MSCCLVCSVCEARIVKSTMRRGEPPWTTTPPTEPGIYWLRWRGNTACVEVVSVQRELVAFATRDEVGIPVLDTEYIGPAHWQRIEAPEVPR